jgi:glycosyltransferase involved in cell wall biosynthesis
MLTTFLARVARRFRGHIRVIGYFEAAGRPRGSVLVSYLPAAVASKNPNRFLGHTNLWECAEIVRLVNELGYAADVISWEDDQFIARSRYAAVLDLAHNLSRLAGPGTAAVLHLTGSEPASCNAAERARLDALAARRGRRLRPRRSHTPESVELHLRSLRRADVVTLVGNEVTLATYPAPDRPKFRLVPVTGSVLSRPRDPSTATFDPSFLFFSGAGAVHKGLDLVLEVFARHPELELHVVGPAATDDDFALAYRHELALPNVRVHRPLMPSSDAFVALAQRVRGFVLPSCSEATSTAAVTCMQHGIFPLVSRECGLDLTNESGITLPDCSIDSIESAVLTVAGMAPAILRERTAAAQRYAMATHSREAFSRAVHAVLTSVLA